MNAVLLLSIVAFVSFMPYSIQAGIPKARCPSNQTATNCEPSNSICNELQLGGSRTCTLDATFCKCNNGYQQIDSKTDRCVLKKDCPVKHCGPGEVWKTCASCDRSCSDLNPICTSECRLGCYCVYGNVRNDQGVCIPESECPAVGTQV